MSREQTAHHWTTSSLDLITGMQDGRSQHPTATLTEIEQALDARLATLRAPWGRSSQHGAARTG
jgi:hypothetical protein